MCINRAITGEKVQNFTHISAQTDGILNLVNLERETEALKEEDAENANEKAYEINLSDELGIADPRALNVSPAFEPSSLNNHDVKYHGNTLVKKIWKLKQIQLEKSINSQKLKLTSDLLQLKEKEFCGSVNCACRTFCRITHKKITGRNQLVKKCFSNSSCWTELL